MAQGGSYGGYMTLRAMAICPERFATGIAQYGFVQNRWMTNEGGDYTWEDEYLGHKTRWPLSEEDQRSDVYNHLASIRKPLLLVKLSACRRLFLLGRVFTASRRRRCCVSDARRGRRHLPSLTKLGRLPRAGAVRSADRARGLPEGKARV